MSVSRRQFIHRVIAASALVAVGIVGLLELVEGQSGNVPPQNILTLQQSSTSVQSSLSSTKGTSQSRTQTVPSGYILLAPVTALSGKSSAYFNQPNFGTSLLFSLNGEWKAFSATCTHAPCTVQYSNSQIYWPCHGGTFNPADGSVTGGPPPSRLPEYGVLVQNNNLYVSSQIIN